MPFSDSQLENHWKSLRFHHFRTSIFYTDCSIYQGFLGFCCKLLQDSKMRAIVLAGFDRGVISRGFQPNRMVLHLRCGSETFDEKQRGFSIVVAAEQLKQLTDAGADVVESTGDFLDPIHREGVNDVEQGIPLLTQL